MSAQTSNHQQSTALQGVTEEWANSHMATVFSRWHPFIAPQVVESRDLIIAEAGVQPHDTVLDVGCGSGVPSLRMAEIVGRIGRVVAVDPSPVFLAAVAENARLLGLTNVQTVQASASSLPFEPGSFDAATCHMSVMFFTNVNAGLTAIRQVLKPGKRAAYAAWGPDEENTMFGSFMSVVNNYLPPAPPPAGMQAEDMPKPSRFARSGSLSQALVQAGYKDVRERSERVNLVWPGHAPSSFDFWMQLTRLGDKLPAERRDAFEQDVLASIERYAEGNAIHHSAKVVIASGAAS